jgi:integron integrase
MESKKQNSPFLEEVRQIMRVQHYAIRTEQSYTEWIKRFILFHDKRHPSEMGEAEVTAFLTHLSVNRNVAPATQGQALNALVFLYRKVLNRPLDEMHGIVRSKKKSKISVVLTQLEVATMLSKLEGVHWLAGCLLYGSGLRLMECIRLRVKDVDFGRLSITVRRGKGGKDRVVTLARELVVPLQRHLESVKMTHERDLAEGFGSVYMPYALNRKYPHAATS